MINNKSIPNFEKPIYENFNLIYNQVLDLKNNRRQYINSKQVYKIYDNFLSILHELTLTRKDEELKGITLNLPNGNDYIIDDIWQLISLCFVTCGLIKFAPATYSSLSTVNKLLDHLKECQVYTVDDLKPIKLRLNEIKNIITNSENQTIEDEIENEINEKDDDFKIGENSSTNSINNKNFKLAISHKREESLLLRNKLNKCFKLYKILEKNFNEIPLDLENIYNDLIKIRKILLNYLTSNLEKLRIKNDYNSKKLSDEANLINNKSHNDNQNNNNQNNYYHNNDNENSDILKSLEILKKQLKEIESERNEEGKFESKVATSTQLNSSQIVLNGLLDDCNNFINDILIQQENSDISSLLKLLSINFDDDYINKFRNLYNKLIELKLTLDNLLITRRWTMRETDLYNYQKSLKLIDDERIKLNENFQENSKNVNNFKNIKRIQIILLYLLRRCYSLIYKLLESSEPVSESLQPIHNQLSTVRRCLLEIKRIDGLNNLRELYPFQFKLASLDNLRNDGKFIINNQIPEGQGTLNALLAECFDIIHELKIELEEKEDDEANENDDNDNDDNSQNNENNSNSNSNSNSNFKKIDNDNITDDEDIKSDDEVELKRSRYVGFNEADYDQDSESDFDDEKSFSASEYEDNDYY